MQGWWRRWWRCVCARRVRGGGPLVHGGRHCRRRRARRSGGRCWRRRWRGRRGRNDLVWIADLRVRWWRRCGRRNLRCCHRRRWWRRYRWRRRQRIDLWRNGGATDGRHERRRRTGSNRDRCGVDDWKRGIWRRRWRWDRGDTGRELDRRELASRRRRRRGRWLALRYPARGRWRRWRTQRRVRRRRRRGGVGGTGYAVVYTW